MSTSLDLLQIYPREVWMAYDSGGHVGLFYNYRYAPVPQGVGGQVGMLSQALLELGPKRLNIAVDDANLLPSPPGERSCHDTLDVSVSHQPAVLFTRNTDLRAFFEEDLERGWVTIASEHPQPDIIVAQPQARVALDRLHRARACSGCYGEQNLQSFLEWRAADLGFYRYELSEYGDRAGRYTRWSQPTKTPILANDLSRRVRSTLIRLSIRFGEHPQVMAPS